MSQNRRRIFFAFNCCTYTCIAIDLTMMMTMKTWTLFALSVGSAAAFSPALQPVRQFGALRVEAEDRQEAAGVPRFFSVFVVSAILALSPMEAPAATPGDMSNSKNGFTGR